jgi:Ca2+-binding EF-hand superfamily protein
VSAAELAAAVEERKVEILERLDANDDGALQEEEIAAGRPSRPGRGGRENVREFDADGDGSITSAELEAGLTARQDEMLETVDTNGDGSLSAEELEAASDRLAEHLLRLDTDEDGAVSSAELAAAVAAKKAEILERLDSNDDGTLSAEELAAANTGCMDREEEEEEAAEVAALVFGEDPAFIRGDANRDDTVNITDAVGLAGHLFLGLAAPACGDAADADDDGSLALTDVIVILQGLFQPGSAGISAPFPDAGEDATTDSLSCDE